MRTGRGESCLPHRVVHHGEQLQGQVRVLEHVHCGKFVRRGSDLFLVAVRPCVKGDGEVITAGDALGMAFGFAVIAVTIYIYGSREEAPLGHFFAVWVVIMLLTCIMELI